MGVWITLLFFVFLIPVMMLGFGYLFRKTEPKSINPLFGYRTARSMKNSETWAFAHRRIGLYWVRMGWWSAAITAVVMLCVFGRSEDTVGKVGSILTLAQLVPMFVSIGLVERDLARAFDKDGNKKET